MTKIQSGYLKTKSGVQLMTTVPYPVGAIYLSIDSTNPGVLFGGTWEQIAQGRTLVGVDLGRREIIKEKKTGGEKAHTLSVGEMPSHNHTQDSHRHRGAETNADVVWNGQSGYADNNGAWATGYRFTNQNGGGYTDWQQPSIQYSGGGQAHNNLQPYYTCYIWLRIA